MSLLSACGQQPDARVTLAILGDISLGRGVIPEPDSLAYLEEELSEADLVLGNLESPLGDPSTASGAGYNLCAPQEHASLLAIWGLDLLSLANNHVNDCTLDGAVTTTAVLEEVGLSAITSTPLLIERNGLLLAFLAFDDVAEPLDEEAALTAVSEAHQSGALVIVSLHWGVEYQGASTPRQQRLALSLAEAGASLIWGHHPHVLLPSGWLDTSAGRTLVLYSLGNALFDQGGLGATRRSALVLVTLHNNDVSKAEAVPFAIDVPASHLKAPDPEQAEQMLHWLGLPGR